MLNKSFEVKQSGELRTLEIYLYGEICADYYDWWQDKVVESTTSANYVRKAIDEAGQVDKINIYINSCGGSVAEGNAIFNILKRHSAYKTVYVDAFAYSVASVIAMAGDKIVMPSNTTIMIHNAMMSAFGNAKELRKAADDLDVINEASCNSYLIKAGEKISKEQLTELLEAETFLTAEDAYKYGFCDEIANPVDLASGVEVVEQAAKNKNPIVKKAVQYIKQHKEKPPEPKSNKGPAHEEKKEPAQTEDKFDWLKNIIQTKNLI